MERILVVRIGNIGDVFMATPLVRKLKNMFPKTAVDFVVSPHAEFAVKANPYIDTLYVYRKYRKASRKIKRFFFKRTLRKNKYKMCFVLETNSEYMRFAHDVCGKDTIKIGFDGYECSNLLDKKRPYSYKMHVIENQLFLLRDFLNATLRENDFTMEFCFPQKVVKEIEEGLGVELEQNSGYFVVHPGCTEYLPFRGWEPDNFAKVIDFLTCAGLHVFITGSNNDIKTIDKVFKACNNHQKVTVFAGRNIFEVVYLISRSCGVLCSDTGILHVTRALNVPMVGLFGPSDPAHTGPVGRGVYKAVRKNFECGPCHYYPEYRIEDKKKCLDGNITPCMKAIPAGEVVELVSELMGMRA